MWWMYVNQSLTYGNKIDMNKYLITEDQYKLLYGKMINYDKLIEAWTCLNRLSKSVSLNVEEWQLYQKAMDRLDEVTDAMKEN